MVESSIYPCYGLVQLIRAFLGLVNDLGGVLLPGGSGSSLEDRQTWDIQQRPGPTVYQ